MIDYAKIKSHLKKSIFGKYIYHLPEIDSTNSYAQRLAYEGAPEGTIIITDFQTEGRGRQNHKWESSKESNILMSLILRPSVKIDRVIKITLATADILISSLENILQKSDFDHNRFTVKWPNDILANGKKIGGVLTESSLREKEVIFVIVGLGLNVNQDISDLSSEARGIATSLYHETNEKFNREAIVAEIISSYEKKYLYLEKTNYSEVVGDWKKRCACDGQAIAVETHAGTETGYYIGVNDDGALIYRTENGMEKELISGSIKYI